MELVCKIVCKKYLYTIRFLKMIQTLIDIDTYNNVSAL